MQVCEVHVILNGNGISCAKILIIIKAEKILKVWWLNNCRVLYISLHRYDNGQFYPGTPDADYNFVGGPGAEGYNINVAWNWDAMGDAEYLAAFHYIIMPVAYEVYPYNKK